MAANGMIMLITDVAHPKYDEGDILFAANARRTEYCHGEMICNHRFAGFTPEGLRPDGISRDAYKATRQFEFARVSGYEVTKTETDLDGNILSQELHGDFLLFKDNLGGTHQIYSRVGNMTSPTPDFKSEIGDALGVTIWTCQITNIRTIAGTQWRSMLITDSNNQAITGCEIRMERMAVGEYLRARRNHHAHRIFGTDGGEVWHGGRRDESEAARDKLWTITENGSAHRLVGICPECGREHAYWPAGSEEVKHFLLVTSEDFTDDEEGALIAPVPERVPNNQPLVDRNGQDVSAVISKLRRYPGYDPRVDKIRQETLVLDANGDPVIAPNGKPQFTVTLIDTADVAPLPEDSLLGTVEYGGERFQWDDATGEVEIKRSERDIKGAIDATLLADISETIERVRDKRVPIANIIASPPDSPIFGTRSWQREKTQPPQTDRGRLYSKRDKKPLPPRGQERGA